MKASVKTWLKVLSPPLVLIAAIVLMGALASLKPEQVRKEPVPVYPAVEGYTLSAGAQPPMIRAQGTVEPLQRTQLTARISGQVVWVAPAFIAGAAFEKGDPLLKIDPLPYESALAETRAREAIAENAYLQERELSEQAERDWNSVGQGEPNPLAVRIPQMERARAEREAARAAVRLAERNLQDTVIRAPYTGRVEERAVDLGQTISAQATVLGRIHGTGTYEVSAPLALDELVLLGVEGTGSLEQAVWLEARVNGERHRWKARFARTSSSLDRQSRMVEVFIRLEAPFASDRGLDLKPGMFVDILLPTSMREGLNRLPRQAVQPGDIVHVIDEQQRLHSVEIKVLYSDDRWAYFREGLEPGATVCLTPLLTYVEGMRVELQNAPISEASPLSATNEP